MPAEPAASHQHDSAVQIYVATCTMQAFDLVCAPAPSLCAGLCGAENVRVSLIHVLVQQRSLPDLLQRMWVRCTQVVTSHIIQSAMSVRRTCMVSPRMGCIVHIFVDGHAGALDAVLHHSLLYNPDVTLLYGRSGSGSFSPDSSYSPYFLIRIQVPLPSLSPCQVQQVVTQAGAPQTVRLQGVCTSASTVSKQVHPPQTAAASRLPHTAWVCTLCPILHMHLHEPESARCTVLVSHTAFLGEGYVCAHFVHAYWHTHTVCKYTYSCHQVSGTLPENQMPLDITGKLGHTIG